jgi:hypothetical protein
MNRFLLGLMLTASLVTAATATTPPPPAPLTDNPTMCFVLSAPEVATTLARTVARGQWTLTRVTTHQLGRLPAYRFHFKANKGNGSLFKNVCFDVHTAPTPNDAGIVISDVTPLYEAE